MTLREAVPWVAAAYILVWVVILAYVWIIGRKLNRLERALDELEAQQQPGMAHSQRPAHPCRKFSARAPADAARAPPKEPALGVP